MTKSRFKSTEGGAPVGAPVSSPTTTAAAKLAGALRKEKNIPISGVHVLTESGTFITRPKMLSTQHMGLDAILNGGIPAGRIVELYSKNEGEGKSSVAAHIMSEMIRQDGLVILIDAECGFTEERLKVFGIDLNKLVYIQPIHIEGVFQAIEETLRIVKDEGIADKTLIVWDSIASTPSRSQEEGDYEDRHVGAHARAVSAGLQKLMLNLSDYECYLLILNQTRKNINAMFGDSTSTTGGKGLKFYASTRIELSRRANAWLKKGDKVHGFKITAEVVKSKTSSPKQTAILHYFYERGVDVLMGLFEFMLQVGIVKKKGAWFTIEGYNKSSGELQSFQQKDFGKVIDALDSSIVDRIRKEMKDNKITQAAIDRFFPEK